MTHLDRQDDPTGMRADDFVIVTGREPGKPPPLPSAAEVKEQRARADDFVLRNERAALVSRLEAFKFGICDLIQRSARAFPGQGMPILHELARCLDAAEKASELVRLIVERDQFDPRMEQRDAVEKTITGPEQKVSGECRPQRPAQGAGEDDAKEASQPDWAGRYRQLLQDATG